MIKTFRDKRTESLYLEGSARGLPPDLMKRAAKKLQEVAIAASLADLSVPSGNRLHPLRGDRFGQHSIAVNDQWRICFRFKDGNAYDVEFCDYH